MGYQTLKLCPVCGEEMIEKLLQRRKDVVNFWTCQNRHIREPMNVVFKDNYLVVTESDITPGIVSKFENFILKFDVTYDDGTVKVGKYRQYDIVATRDFAIVSDNYHKYIFSKKRLSSLPDVPEDLFTYTTERPFKRVSLKYVYCTVIE